MFSNQKSQFLVIFEGLGKENFCTFYGKLVYFKVIWYILWIFGLYFPNLACCKKINLAALSVTDKCHGFAAFVWLYNTLALLSVMEGIDKFYCFGEPFVGFVLQYAVVSVPQKKTLILLSI
jgi:hypothetical protein